MCKMNKIRHKKQKGSKVDRVIFRKEEDGEICAFFIDNVEQNGHVLCYSHIEQHCTASLSYMIQKTMPCESMEEYKDLYDELIIRGYNLKVVLRYTPKR